MAHQNTPKIDLTTVNGFGNPQGTHTLSPWHKKEQGCPDIKKLIRSHYSPKGYCLWEKHIRTCHAIAKLDGYVNTSEHISVLACRLHEIENSPPRYIDHNLAESLLHTDLARLDPPPPVALPFMRIFFPQGLLELRPGVPIETALVTSWNEAAGRSYNDPGLLVVLPLSDNETAGVEFLWNDPNGSRFKNDPNLSMQDINIAARLCAHAILVMAYMPELVAADHKHKPPGGHGFGRNKKDVPTPAAPIWIGRNFQCQTEPARPRTGDEPPGRQPLRAHWRRGHWRSVACGVKRQKRQLRWIKPVFVNASNLLDAHPRPQPPAGPRAQAALLA